MSHPLGHFGVEITTKQAPANPSKASNPTSMNRQPKQPRKPGGPQQAAEWVALARQRALFGGPHPLVQAIDRLPEAEQDLVDRFLMAVSLRGGSAEGKLIGCLEARTLRLLGANAERFLPTLLATLLQAARENCPASGKKRDKPPQRHRRRIGG